jgi:hypothetical protein
MVICLPVAEMFFTGRQDILTCGTMHFSAKWKPTPYGCGDGDWLGRSRMGMG